MEDLGVRIEGEGWGIGIRVWKVWPRPLWGLGFGVLVSWEDFWDLGLESKGRDRIACCERQKDVEEGQDGSNPKP